MVRWLWLLVCVSGCASKEPLPAEDTTQVSTPPPKPTAIVATPAPEDGAVAVVEMAEASEPQAVGQNRYVVPRAFVNTLVERLPKTMRADPVRMNGTVTGIRLSDMGDENPLYKLGLENGDELRTLNGVSLSSPEQALKAYGQARNADAIDLELSRNGTPLTLHYDIIDER